VVTHLHVDFKVKDYKQWKKGYDASKKMRRAAGEVAFTIYRDLDDPNTVTVLSVQKDAEGIKAFMESPDLKKLMEEAGIIQMGRMYIMEETDRGIF